MNNEKSKVIIVFGGARGIGGETAKYFASKNYTVVAADVLIDEGKKLANSSKNIHFVKCDVGSESDINSVYDYTMELNLGLDVVFNNVGIARYGEVDVLSLDDWNLTMKINLTSQFLSCKRAVIEMKKLGHDSTSGVIINTASILGHASQKTTSAYSASKAAVMGLTRTIAIDHAKDNIRCLSISPGTIDTPLVQIAAETFTGKDPKELRKAWANHHPLKRLGTPLEVAKTVYFLASDGAGFMTGSDVLIDGGIRSELYAE